MEVELADPVQLDVLWLLLLLFSAILPWRSSGLSLLLLFPSLHSSLLLLDPLALKVLDHLFLLGLVLDVLPF